MHVDAPGHIVRLASQTQAPQVHASVQLCSLPGWLSQLRVESGLQPAAAMLHALQSLFHMPVLVLQVRVCTPQGLFGQGRVAEPVHI